MDRLRALAVPVLTAAIQLCSAWLAIGVPDVGRSVAFLSGDLTMAGALAASEVLVWTAVALVATWTVAALVVQVRRSPELTTPFAQSWELAVLVVGVIVLVGGGVHHFTGSAVDLGGGSVQQARGLAGG